MIAAVFAMQGFGIMMGALVSISVLAAFRDMIIDDDESGKHLVLDNVWRLCILAGALPGSVAIFYRLTIPESPRYTLDVDRDIERAFEDVSAGLERRVRLVKREVKLISHAKTSLGDFFSYFSKWRHFKLLLATSATWFALDIAFYGISLNQSNILNAIEFNKNLSSSSTSDQWNALFTNSLGNLIISLMGTVPGYWLTVFLIDRMGRKSIQLMGFLVLSILLAVLGFGFEHVKSIKWLFIAIFTLAQFFQNFGPNATTFIIPAEVFPTRFRSTAHGISAATGKLGAIISQSINTNYYEYKLFCRIHNLNGQ